MTPSVAYDPDAQTTSKPTVPLACGNVVVDGVPSHVNLAHRGEGAREPRSSFVSSVR